MFNDVIIKHGKPEAIVADNSTQVTSQKWKKALQNAGISVKFSSVWHPEPNPVERQMRGLVRLFRILRSEKHAGWEAFLP